MLNFLLDLRGAATESSSTTQSSTLTWRAFSFTGRPATSCGTTRYGFLGIGSEATELNGRPNATGYFDGELDDVHIYSRALSQAEIAYLADATPGDGESYIPVASAANIYDEEGQGFKAINFKDFAVLAEQWLDEELWPAP